MDPKQTDYLSHLQGLLKDAGPKMEKMFGDAQDMIKNAKPNEQKNIVIDNTPCVLQLFEDKVSVVFPTRKDGGYFKHII